MAHFVHFGFAGGSALGAGAPFWVANQWHSTTRRGHRIKEELTDPIRSPLLNSVELADSFRFQGNGLLFDLASW
jgi:hypothetical protein